MIVLMKKYHDHQLGNVVLFTVCMAMIVATAGCIASSSRKTNIADVPVPTLPRMVEPAAIDRGKESYLIYSAILNHKWNNGSIVVRDHTDRGLFQNDEWLDNNVGKSYPEAVRDFKTVNDKDVQIENRFDYSGKVSLIDQQEFKKTIGGGDGWDQFRKNRPGTSGIVTFSAVGFDSGGNHAVVNVAYLCANHCGNGSFYILQKTKGEWAISQEIGTWVS